MTVRQRPFTGTARFRDPVPIGQGSMGVVYRVHDLELGHHVALKTLPGLDADRLYRLKREFRALADVAHPNLVQRYELIVSDDACFFTMELVDGVGFVEYVRHGTPDSSFDPARLRDAAAQLARGVAALHAAGTLHRDLKPSNVLVAPGGRVVVLDFGLSTLLVRDAAFESLVGFAGTLAYMAPELAWGRSPTPASDWYSVGVMLHEAVSGHVPFESAPPATMFARSRVVPPRLRTLVPGVPDAIDALVAALLDFDPAARPHVEQIERALGGLSGGDSPPAVAASPSPAEQVPFVGRDAELRVLRASFDRLQEGQPAIVRVHGSSGIGKTELVRQFLTRLRGEAGLVVLRSRCRPQELVPYKALDPIVDELSRFLSAQDESHAAAFAPRYAAALVRLFPVLGRVAVLATASDVESGAEPHEIRRRGAGALRELLARIADRRPVVLWIDDLQWGDADSGALLRELLRPPDPPRMLVLLSHRQQEAEPRSFLRSIEAGWEDVPREWTRELEVHPLPASDAERLAALVCPVEVAPALRSEIASESAGSPFFIGELARHLGTLHEQGELSEPAHLRVADVIHERVQRLPAAARRMLEAVSLGGGRLDRAIVFGATGAPEEGSALLATLEQRSLLRSAVASGRPALEVVHDRIREAVVARVPPAERARHHRRIAETLAAQPDPEPQALFEHWRGAGEVELAVRFAIVAGDRAADTLAFDRAAQLYQEALALGAGPGERGSLHIKLAEALANRGWGGGAAEHFEAAAASLGTDAASRDQALSLRCRAAEHYLRSGHIDRGSALMRGVLAEVGIPLPRTSQGAMLSALLQRARLLLGGTASRTGGDASPRRRLRLQACVAATTGLAVVDPVVADGIGLRCLREALDIDDRSWVGRALGNEAVWEASIGGRFFRRRSARLLQVVEGLARATADPYDHASAERAVGQVAYFEARWRQARERCDAATEIWREHCRGVAWEIAVMDSFALSALAHMGELRELSRRLPAVLADTDERGDILQSTSLRMGVPSMMWLAEGRAAYAREQADQAIARWPADRFLVQHYLHLIATVQAELCLGDPWAAWRRVRAAWPRLRRARILAIASVRVELRHLRARAALAAAAAVGQDLASGTAPPDRAWPVARLLRAARADARRVARSPLPSAAPFAALIEAGVAQVIGRTAEAAAASTRAAEDFGRAEMGLYAAAAGVRAGTLLGGDEGDRLRASGEAWMRAQGVVDRDAMLAMLAPGYPLRQQG